MALVPEDDLPGSLRANFVPESDLPSDLRVGRRRPEPKPKEAGFSIADTALSLAEGAVGATKAIAQAFGPENVVAETLGGAQKAITEKISPERLAERQRRAEIEKEAAKSGDITKEIGAFLGGVKEAPIQSVAQAAGSVVPAAVAGLAAAVSGAPAAIAGAVTIGARFLLGAIQGAGEVKGSIYDNVKEELIAKGESPDVARQKALAAQEYLGKNAANILVGTGLGGLAAGTGVEKAIGERVAAKVGTEAAKEVAKKEVAEGLGKRVIKGAGAEAIPEGGQAGQEQYAANIALGREGVETPAFQGVAGAAARDALTASILGGAVSTPRPARAEVAPPVAETPVEPPAKEVPAQPIVEERPVEKPIVEPPVEEPPVAKPPVAKPPEVPVAKQKDLDNEFKDYYTNMPEGSDIVFQNRDRSTQASIAQMQSIAAKPDYSRVSESKDFGTGAPVVISDINLAESPKISAVGKKSEATLANGERVPVMYAVVDSGLLQTSNNASGATNPDYADLSRVGLRAIAGNGRIAGITQAYEKGTAEQYKSDLIKDLQNLGINAEAVQGMESPVLVRVMPKSYLTPDIADISNRGGIARLSPVDTAKNDVKRFALDGVIFNEDGTPDSKSIMQFINAMPVEERPDLTDDKGQPTAQAYDRMANAIFQQAYNSDSLIKLYAQAADPEAKTILNALARVAPKMAQLQDAGEYDVRNAVIQAAEAAVNARRRGANLAAFAKQGDISMDPNAAEVLSMFGENSRSAKKIGDRLDALAEAAITAKDQTGTDMFGEKPKTPIEDVYKAMQLPSEPGGLFAEPPVQEPTENKRYEISKSKEQIAKEIDGMTIPELSQWTIDNAPNSPARAIATAIHDIMVKYEKRNMFRTPVEVKNNKARFKGGTRGRTTYAYNARGINFHLSFNGIVNGKADKQTGTNYITILHELLHVATTAELHFINKDSDIYKDLNKVLNRVRKQIREDKAAGVKHPILDRIEVGSNTVKNVKELVSWGMTDPDFQDYLSKIQFGKKNGFGKLVELFRKMLGLDQQYETALEAVARNTEQILGKPIEDITAEMGAKGYALVGDEGVGKQGVEESRVGEAIEKGKEAVTKALQKRKAPEGVMAGLPKDLADLAKPIFFPENKTIVQKIEGLQDGFWKRMAQGIADRYRSIKDISPEAYMMARLASTTDGALDGLLFHGHVFNDGGALNIKQNTKGLLEAMKPVGQEVDRYQMWIALNREAALPAEKRSKFPNLDKLIARRNEFAEGEIDGKSRLEVYKQVQKDMNAINKSVLDVALNAGLIDQDGYDRFSKDINYIPFYRQMEGGDLGGAATSSGLTNQYFSRELKGGERPYGDLMENTLRNWSHILSSAMKNQAALATVNAATKMGAAEPISGAEKGAVKVMIDGKPQYYKVMDPMLMESISAIGFTGPKSIFLDVARDFKNMLQFGVTLSPAFKIRNLFRDSISALAVTDLKRNPFANVIQGWMASDRNNPAHISALAGGAIFNFGTAYEGNQSKLIKRLLDSGVDYDHILDSPDKVKKGLSLLWNKYQDWGNKSEAANRMALYNQMREKGMSHMEATFYAKDMLDFSMHGSWAAFRLASQTIPFLNARIQGLYKLGKDGILPTSRVLYNTVTNKPIEADDAQKARSFGYTTLAVSLASMMLYMAFKDDEEFKKREAWDRDNFWWIKLPGMEAALRIPKPFEIGAFGTMAERTLEQIIDQGAEGKQFGDSLTRMLSDTFAINPTPQFIRPLYDLYANKDSFTGAPIESAGMERLSKQERATDATSPIAKLLGGASTILGEKAELSPVQIDYAIKAYFGWLGGTATEASKYAVMPFRDGEYPDTKWIDKVSQGFIKTLPATQSGYVTSFYENNKQISQAYADMRHYAELGDSEKVVKIYEEKGDKIALAKFYDKTAKEMSNIRKQIRLVESSTSMDGATKREMIDRMKLIISELAQQAEEARKSVKKP